MPPLRFALAATVATILVACGGDSRGTSTGGSGSDDDSPGGPITVFAAASLTDAFAAAAEIFEAANPGITVELHLAGSSALREQILDGAPADVFASADQSNMAVVVEAGAATDPQPFVENELVIAVPSANEAGVDGLEDFADGGLLLGLCAAEVPCGELSRQVLANADITPSIDTEEPDVRSLLAKVAAGELDAGIVYRTDVLGADDTVDSIEIRAEHNVVARYQIALLSESSNPGGAAAFLAFLRGGEGQAILESYGFRGVP